MSTKVSSREYIRRDSSATKIVLIGAYGDSIFMRQWCKWFYSKGHEVYFIIWGKYTRYFWPFTYISEVDPLLCLSCGGEMHVIAFIEDHKAIDKIIKHLKRSFIAERPPPPQVLQALVPRPVRIRPCLSTVDKRPKRNWIASGMRDFFQNDLQEKNTSLVPCCL